MCVRGKSASWHLEEIMAPLARIKARDRRPKIWLVTSPSSTPLEFFGPLFRSAFLVNKKSLFLQKCQWGSVARRLGQMPSIFLQGDNNQLPLLQGDTAHTNFFYFSFKGTHTNYLYYSFKGTHRAHTLTFSTSLQWGTHQTTSTSTILPILILLLLLFLSL